MTARDSWAQVAHNLRVLADSIDAAIEPDAARASVPERVPSPPAASPEAVPPAASGRLPQRPPQESAFTECPAHNKPWSEGRYGEMCTGRGEPDGNNWVNDKGYCKVTPRSAGAWVKQHPQGAPAPRREFDPEEVPF